MAKWYSVLRLQVSADDGILSHELGPPPTIDAVQAALAVAPVPARLPKR